MITPRFKLSQSDSELVVTVYAPFARIYDADINIEETVFIFYSSPYYLRLSLPGKLIDSEKEMHKATFDADQEAFVIKCVKQTFGEHFAGLDMLTDLLTPKGLSDVSKPLIEVLDSDECDEEEEFDWFYEQKLPDEDVPDGFRYGFNNSHTNVFSTLRSELSGLVDVSDPDEKGASQRRKERVLNEKESFKEDHYLADLFENDAFTPNLKFEPSFYTLLPQNVEYTSTEEETLLKLPRKKVSVPKGSRAYLYFTLVDLVFAWCYNHRVTMGENCSESAWNIAKLSPTLSWLDSFCSLKDVATSVTRRSLVFPLIRNWDFSLLVLKDVIQVLSLGKKQVLKCLLETHSLFNHYEPYYILNQLYITDYCVWIQCIKEDKIISLANSLKTISVSKDDIGFELVELECAAQMVLTEEDDEEEEEEEAKQKEAAQNLNNVVNSLDQMSVIENAFALSRNDNEADANYHHPPPPPPPPLIISQEQENRVSVSDDDSSSSSSSSSSDDDSDDATTDTDSDDDDDDTDSSSGTSSLDSDDEVNS